MNVWRPAEESAHRRPVMAWIHGGGFEYGSIFWGNYNGGNLASSGDVVLVSINYRLGPFGFLNGPNGTGNMGLHDMLLGLQWIRDNVQYFGGDPSQVSHYRDPIV